MYASCYSSVATHSVMAVILIRGCTQTAMDEDQVKYSPDCDANIFMIIDVTSCWLFSIKKKLLRHDIIARTTGSGSYHFVPISVLTEPCDDETTLVILALCCRKTPNNIFSLLQLYNFVRGNSVTLWRIIF